MARAKYVHDSRTVEIYSSFPTVKLQLEEIKALYEDLKSILDMCRGFSNTRGIKQ
jgi:hypothetical protein